MVAKIITGKSMRGALLYNEQKIDRGQAELILAAGFGMDISRLGFEHKLGRFESLTCRRESIKTNTLHISLNFPPEENLGVQQLQEIGLRYMNLIGFGEQPFLIYRHSDAAHDHLHIVTTQVQSNGIPIALNGLGRVLSEPARKTIEEEFGLIRADRRKKSEGSTLVAANLAVAEYGKVETKRAINNIVLAISRDYRYTSLTEFNSALEQFNVTCEQGAPGTRQHDLGGLTYSLLDNTGEKIGVPIKASLFYCKPTLKNLEKRFKANREKRKAAKAPLCRAIEHVLLKYDRLRMETFSSELARIGISARFVRNENGRYFGVTFIDHKRKAVFKGSDLGKLFTAEALTTQFATRDQAKTYLDPKTSFPYARPATSTYDPQVSRSTEPTLFEQLLDKTPVEYGPTTLPKRKKKRRRPGLSR